MPEMRCLDSTRIALHDAHMRTTVTLDPDVERLVKDAVRKTGKSFKEVLNRAVRTGLIGQTMAPGGKPFRVRARRLGLRSGIDPGALNRLADDHEVEEFVGKRNARR